MKRVFVLLLASALAACLHLPDDQHRCGTDADCVPSECCHAADAVNRDHAPDCEDVGCTTEYLACTTDNPDVVPLCRLGACTLSTTPACLL